MKLLITSGAFLCLPACEDEKPDEPPVSAVTDSPASMIVPRSDSTSHRYSWRTWLFGDGGFEGSAWLGVSAINENNAIVVGHIAQRDSIRAQHAAKWDGTSWKYFYVYMQRIGLQYVDPDSINLPIGSVHHVWGEPPNNWTFAVSRPIYFDETTFVTDHWFYRRPDSVTAMNLWGNEADRWFYGLHGKITHASGRTYTIQPSVTNREIQSMAANKHEAWAVSLRELPGLVLHYSGGIWTNEQDHIASVLNSTWAVWCDEIGMRPGGTVVMVGKNIVQYDTMWFNATGPLVDFMPRRRFFLSVHGSGRNNIWAVGDYGSVAHYNGNTWVRYPELAGESDVRYWKVWALEKHVFIVGQKGQRAIIIMGTRVD